MLWEANQRAALHIGGRTGPAQRRGSAMTVAPVKQRGMSPAGKQGQKVVPRQLPPPANAALPGIDHEEEAVREEEEQRALDEDDEDN